MKFLFNGNVQRIALGEITVGPRLRGVNAAQVEALVVMAEETGITTPVHVRRLPGGYDLIDGAHRLAAARQMGLEDIAALVVECGAGEARAMEASNNLGAARMTPLQTAVFVASWKRDYYARHPERRAGTFKGNQFKGKVVTEISSVTTSIAHSLGITERRVFQILACGEMLEPAEVARIEEAGRRVSMEDLAVLSKIADGDERAAVIDAMLADGRASAGRARRAIRDPKVPRDPADLAWRDLSARWRRAPARVKRRFVEEFGRDLEALMAREARE